MGVHDAEAEKEVKRLLGIPDDEPIFLLRGQDKLAARTVMFYDEAAFEARQGNGMELTEEWRANLRLSVDTFCTFADENSQRMKFPD